MRRKRQKLLSASALGEVADLPRGALARGALAPGDVPGAACGAAEAAESHDSPAADRIVAEIRALGRRRIQWEAPEGEAQCAEATLAKELKKAKRRKILRESDLAELFVFRRAEQPLPASPEEVRGLGRKRVVSASGPCETSGASQ